MFDYRARVIDAELFERLTSIGAVLIDGPKGCGKTETALQQAKSSVRFDTDPNARALLGLNPDELFDQETPILFDEWHGQVLRCAAVGRVFPRAVRSGLGARG